MEPISLGIMAAQMAVGVAGNNQRYKAQRQAYANQTAFQDTQAAFNRWQAGFNARTQNLNNQYKYWGETLQYNSQMAYAGQLENYEFAKEIAQAERVMQARASAGANYLVNQDAIAAAYSERGIQEAVAQQQYMYRGLQASAAYQAGASEGKSTDRYVRNFARQQGDYATIKAVKDGMATRQLSRQQLGNIVQYLNQYNSQQFYQKAPIQKPVAPFPPLPAMITAPQPYMRGAAPADTRFLDNATTAFSALNTGLETNRMIRGMAAGEGSSNNLVLAVNRLFGGVGGKP